MSMNVRMREEESDNITQRKQGQGYNVKAMAATYRNTALTATATVKLINSCTQAKYHYLMELLCHRYKASREF